LFIIIPICFLFPYAYETHIWPVSLKLKTSAGAFGCAIQFLLVNYFPWSVFL